MREARQKVAVDSARCAELLGEAHREGPRDGPVGAARTVKTLAETFRTATASGPPQRPRKSTGVCPKSCPTFLSATAMKLKRK